MSTFTIDTDNNITRTRRLRKQTQQANLRSVPPPS
jgi:hypothetical protein